jgi:hypothetical protein
MFSLLKVAPGNKSGNKQQVETKKRDVAQPGRALVWGTRGRKFKSCRPDKKTLVNLMGGTSVFALSMVD